MIIVPCYKAANFLSVTIESVLHQGFSDWELILAALAGTWTRTDEPMPGNTLDSGFIPRPWCLARRLRGPRFTRQTKSWR